MQWENYIGYIDLIQPYMYNTDNGHSTAVIYKTDLRLGFPFLGKKG